MNPQAIAKSRSMAPKKGGFEAAKGKVEGGQPGEPMQHEQHGAGVGEQHAKEGAGTQAHPKTGVHAVHIHHMGGGMVKTHTHHDDGHIETKDHGSMDEAKGHTDQMLPSDDEQAQDQPQDSMPEAGSSADAGMSGSLGNIAG
jgi:hypothetical protein